MEHRIGLAGVGKWGKNLAKKFAEREVLYAVCDTDPKNLRECKRLYPKLKATTSFSELIEDVDAVAIATPSKFHYEMAREALLKDKDVFVEKPICLKVDEARELCEIAEERKRILMVGHILRYHPAIIKLKEMVEDGVLGRIYYIYSNRLNLGRIRQEENALFSFAPHDISVMLYLLNETPISVSAYGGSYLNKGIADVTITNLEFSSRVKAHIFVSWLHPYKEQKLIVVGEKAMALFNDVAETNKLLLYPHRIEWKGKIPVASKEDAVSIEFEKIEPLSAECEHFLDCIRDRKTPITDGREGLRVLEVLERAQLSLEVRRV
jgi:UDP-2-acetamido-3-amino-2,3-dideoxy-glucuronate N-acetyltransferase